METIQNKGKMLIIDYLMTNSFDLQDTEKEYMIKVIEKLKNIWEIDRIFPTQQKLIDLIPPNLSDNDNIEHLKELGNKSLGYGDFDSAIDFFTEAIEISPNVHDLLIGRAAANLKKGSFIQAISDYEHAISINPLNPITHTKIIFCLYSLNSLNDSRIAFYRALQMCPNDETLLEMRTIVGNYPTDEEIQHLTNAIKEQILADNEMLSNSELSSLAHNIDENPSLIYSIITNEFYRVYQYQKHQSNSDQ
ncbi:small glutamine-rich tetratricopeptide repeat-containing protein alpha [Histomonas meleagridis]|uniref:small glutamine-rich tetratricopeptide repeat-containing protein alpha n=1 Tax=Histomonas meleagridis TaxID=135588 RepID=UPI003559F1DF|nr:small glutamine-rich tetratricopeptide repeat-containing protein alpha [Histomonas meleagridis]KAH0805891.1 small glutamine-rich tetratricopeptide repeat-containing protein alpha [Histomonas meleagridis]